MKRLNLRTFLAMCLMILLPLAASAANDDATMMTAQQKEELNRAAPGFTLTPENAAQMRAIAFDQTRSIEERAAALKELTGFGKGEPVKRRVCIWDIAGRSGPIFTAAMDQRTQILKYGVDVELIPFTNESVLAEDLKAGMCDAALMSGLRARLFHKYAGTIDAVGAVPSQEHMKVLLRVLAHPKSAPRMVSGEYVILGIAPAGAAYVFVNDRSINSLAAAAGRKVAVLDYDKTQAEMVASVGATPIASDIVSAPNKFNNGVVDVLAAPLVAYEVLELYKGMSPDGGIVEYPLAQITMQLIGRKDKFPNELAQLVREAFFQNYDLIRQRLAEEEAKVPAKWWIPLPEKDKQQYEVMMQEARLELRQRGYYDADMLSLQRKIRCKLDANRAECANPVE
ncbi:MAG: DUF6091 family protein [Alcanivoracaceae bacterium]|jgi:hypothetical protein|nr:DUF6091 family protein [Alcanivoracaceae bacterium]